MISSRNPESFKALHSLVSYKNILQGFIKSMSHMKLTCNVRGRNNYCIRLLILIYLSMKISFFNPLVIELVLKLLRIIIFCNIICVLHNHFSFQFPFGISASFSIKIPLISEQYSVRSRIFISAYTPIFSIYKYHHAYK